MIEEWKIINRFQDYMISNFGRVKSFKRYREGKILSDCKNKNNYLYIKLYKNNKKVKIYVHRLVLENFKYIGNIYKFECNHIDGNKENNYIKNLEWCNRLENIKHAYRIGLRKPAMLGKNHSQNTKDKIRRKLKIIKNGLKT